MNKQEKIKYILDLASRKEEFFCSLLSVVELNKMLELLKKYDKGIHSNMMAPEDVQAIKTIQRNHHERVKQLTPEEIENVRMYNNHQGDWQIFQAVKIIHERLGLNNRTQTI
jgi:hypothetical protein